MDTLLLIEESKENKNIKGFITLIDTNKAFDKLNRKYLIKTLQKFKLGENFIKQIILLYKNTIADIKINNKISKTIPINSGVKQGCPLSPLLFSIATTPLINAILKDKLIEGITIENYNIRTAWYADDSQLFAKNVKDLKRQLEIFNKYEKAANQIINKDKSVIIPINIKKTDELKKI